MNDKLAKSLRAAAQYRNQTATPGVMPFPGVARLYAHPVYERRTAVKTGYVRLPMSSGVTKVFTKVTSMVHGAGEKPVLKMEANARYKMPLQAQDLSTGKMVDRPGTVDYRAFVPATQVVPVSKPARLDPQGAKGMYRAVKRLARKGLLTTAGLGSAFFEASLALQDKQPAQVPA